MKFTILGSGSVKGAPVYGCSCVACERAQKNKEFKRRPASALVETDNFQLLIDAGRTDLEELFPPGKLKHILLTHYHMDHVQGLFELRWGQGLEIQVIGPDDKKGCDDLFKHPGIFDFSQKAFPFKSFTLGPFHITPLPMQHSKLTHGYLIEYTCQDAAQKNKKSIAYLTDTCGLADEVIHFLQEASPDLMVLDCSFPPCDSAPRNHNDWNMAWDIYKEIGARENLFTHIGHDLDAWFLGSNIQLPEDLALASDGMCVYL